MKGKKPYKYKTVLPLVISSIVVIFIVGIFWAHHQLTINDYCTRQAQQIVSKYGDKEVPVTEADKRQAPGAVNTTNGKIFRGFSEQLKCEREHSYFGLF